MKLSHQYDDILDLPHHVSETHAPMPMHDRAAQFSPFAALTGYGAAIEETARPTEEKRELSEEQKLLLGRQLRELKQKAEASPCVAVTFFRPDAFKSGGAYECVRGHVKKVDEYRGFLELADGTRIPLEDIAAVEPEEDGPEEGPLSR